MTNYAAESIGSPTPQVLTERSGTAAADAVPAGVFVVWRNTGAGTHNITLTTNNTAAGGLAVADLSFALTAGQIKGGQILPEWGDANGFVQISAIDGTASEIKYYILGGV